MIPFSRFSKLYIFISSLILIPGIISLVFFGLKPAIDFTGGALFEYQLAKEVAPETVKEVFQNEGIDLFSIQTLGNSNLLLRTNPISSEKTGDLLSLLKEKTNQEIKQLRFETVGPILGKELLQKTTIAVILSIIAILFYIGYSFKNITYGMSAIIALLHDSLVLIGIFSLLGHFFQVEVDSLFVTAVLTTASFSVHDTIVVFDRIREIRKLYPKLTLKQVSDVALSETMVRSLNNSFTIIFMLTALILLGGDTVKWFAVALLVGTVSGTYSSPFVATPMLLFLTKLKEKKKN